MTPELRQAIAMLQMSTLELANMCKRTGKAILFLKKRMLMIIEDWKPTKEKLMRFKPTTNQKNGWSIN
jgi:DNA-directed RNA polymerase specialized sigma54-like protein